MGRGFGSTILFLILSLGAVHSGRANSLTPELSDPKPKTLKDAYQAAVLRSEALSMQMENWTQADLVDSQAVGALFPTINGSYSFQQQGASSSATGSSIFPSSQNLAKITLAQPLFRGLRDFAALRQKKSLVGAQQQAFLAAARQLFYDLSTAYYNVLSYQQDEKNYVLEIDINRKRLKELNAFVRIGRSQLTDVLSLRANIVSLEAELEKVHGQSETAKDILSFLTGWPRTFLVQDSEPFLEHPDDIQSYLTKIEERPEVKAAIENAQASDEGVAIAFGQHLPSIDFLGNYYLKRPGVLSDVSWDIQLAMTVPIFQGGVVQSQVNQARSISRQLNLQLSQARRLAEQEIRTFYNTLSADAKQLVKLKELVEVSQLNFQTQSKYYRNGLVTNLEVLQATSSYRSGVRQLERQNYTLKMDTVKLQAATAQRAEIVVKLEAQ